MSEIKHAAELTFDTADEYRPEPPTPPLPPAWKDGSIRLGIHTSIAGDITHALEIARGLGANALQIFSASPRMWDRGLSRSSPFDLERFRARRQELALGPLVVHCNYLLNLASPDPVLRARSVQAFHREMVRAVGLGADYLVLHPGCTLAADKGSAITAVARGLKQAARGLKLGELRILVENTAGQGSSLGSRFEELRAILDACPDLALGVCIDTAHIFAAGWDIRTSQGWESTLYHIDRTVGIGRLGVVHFNDSKAALGSHVDRHEHIGKGKIGLEALGRILNHPLLSSCAFILETPIDKPGDDKRNLAAAWRLVGRRGARTETVRSSSRRPTARWRPHRSRSR
ncbi:MAG TPA: deoxyribonuclease IV [Candidatus Acidoferrales bacterium]|nr:deoxyribonuclease IV [Candidatus Acidoferrales bacterium]